MSMLLQKHCAVEIKAIDEKTHRVQAVASSGTIDRDEEIILGTAWSLERFKSNPVFLYNHASRSDDPQNVLGQVMPEMRDEKLHGTFDYDVDINPKAAMVFAQVQKGTLRAFSVGFIPKAWVTDYSPREQIDALPEDARKALESGKVFVVYTNVELVEISQVPVPSNPDALVGASLKAFRLKQLEDEMSKEITPAVKAAPEVAEVAAELKEGPDVAALVESAVAKAMAPVLEALAKLAPPPVEKAVEPCAKSEALAALAALPQDQLDSVMANMDTDERKALVALLN